MTITWLWAHTAFICPVDGGGLILLGCSSVSVKDAELLAQWLFPSGVSTGYFTFHNQTKFPWKTEHWNRIHRRANKEEKQNKTYEPSWWSHRPLVVARGDSSKAIVSIGLLEPPPPTALWVSASGDGRHLGLLDLLTSETMKPFVHEESPISSTFSLFRK